MKRTPNGFDIAFNLLLVAVAVLLLAGIVQRMRQKQAAAAVTRQLDEMTQSNYLHFKSISHRQGLSNTSHTVDFSSERR